MSFLGGLSKSTLSPHARQAADSPSEHRGQEQSCGKVWHCSQYSSSSGREHGLNIEASLTLEGLTKLG